MSKEKVTIRLDQILEGWINYARAKKKKSLSPEIMELSEERSKICKECPSLIKKEFRVAGKEIFRHKCEECGCPFPMLTYSKRKKCPKGKW